MMFQLFGGLIIFNLTMNISICKSSDLFPQFLGTLSFSFSACCAFNTLQNMHFFLPHLSYVRNGYVLSFLIYQVTILSVFVLSTDTSYLSLGLLIWLLYSAFLTFINKEESYQTPTFPPNCLKGSIYKPF